MGRRRFGLKLSCVSIARVLSASTPFASKSSPASIKYGDTTEFPSMTLRDDISCDHEDGNKVMVAVTSGFEAACALDWALSHAVQPQDTVLLLHLLIKPSSRGTETEQGERLRLKSHQLLVDMKNKCQMKRPGVQVRVVKVEGEERESDSGRGKEAESVTAGDGPEEKIAVVRLNEEVVVVGKQEIVDISFKCSCRLLHSECFLHDHRC